MCFLIVSISEKNDMTLKKKEIYIIGELDQIDGRN